MKKHIIRALILCLVLSLVIGAAFAEETWTLKSISISGGNSVLVGKTLKLTASATYEKAADTDETDGEDGETQQPGDGDQSNETQQPGDGDQSNETQQPDENGQSNESQDPSSTPVVEEVTLAATGDSEGTPETKNEDVTGEATWTSSAESVATVAGGVVTGVGLGTTTITASLDGVTSQSFTVNVTSEIECSNANVGIGDTVTLKPTVSGLQNAEFSYSTAASTNGQVSAVSGASGSFKGTKQGQVAVTISVTNAPAGITIPSKTVYIGVYDSYDVNATISKSPFKINDDSAISKLSIDGVSRSWSLYEALAAPDGYSIVLDSSTMNVGYFSSKSLLIGSETFTMSKEGTDSVGFSVYSSKNCLVGTGTLTITTSNVSGAIEYSTSYQTKKTFNASDFISYFNSVKAKENLKGTLDYVVFHEGSMPAYGEIYTDSTAKKLASTELKFKAYYNSESGYYDLDNVTYVPDSNKPYVTSVTIPFTAVSTKNESVLGTVVINITNKGLSITSRGISFGDKSLGIIDVMKEVYKTQTGETLSYVTFPSLNAKYGKLFAKFSGILSSNQVSKDTAFYITASGTQFKLEEVAFVPRADYYGEVTIDFIGYSGSNKSANCSITFNVSKKTASAAFTDVTASSYSWAADSVDFLYYEGVANGSGGKYNPASNITRGDFMLMLYRAFLEEDYEDYNVTSNFPDVVKGSDSYSQETYQAVGVAKYLGIAQGTNGKYNPKAYITREEAMTLIYRTLDEVGYSMSYTVSTDTDDFKDYSSVSSYAKTAISDLIEHGVVVGTNSKINPKSNITRAEMAVILHRVLTY